jgi:hypothetical protein
LWDNFRRVRRQEVGYPALLAKIAGTDEDAVVCLAAVENLTDHKLLTKIAANAWAWPVREAAAEKINDEALRTKIAIKDGRDILKLER